MRSLTIGIDASFLARDGRGMGRSVRCILDCWRAQATHRLVLLCHQRRHLSGLQAYAREGWQVALASQAPKLDVCWFPWSRVDWDSQCPSVVFIHDVVPFTPFHPPKHGLADQSRLRRAAALADHIMTNSQFSKAEILRYLQPSGDDIGVVPLACDTNIFHQCPGQAAPPLGLRKNDFLLYVGNLEPRKNLSGLLAGLAKADTRLPLVLVCPKPVGSLADRLFGRSPSLSRQLKSLGDRLLWAEGASDQTLVSLYQNARLFIMPSHYEGFGLPLLEAMACGCPTAAARASSLPEVGGEAPCWFDPASPPDIARALDQALAQSRGDSSAVLEQAARFSWRKSALRTMEILESAAEGQVPRAEKQAQGGWASTPEVAPKRPA